MSFETLAAVNPAVPAPSALAADAGAARERGIVLAPRTPEFFVPPELDAAPGFTENRPFWLVSAPAAVGKTVLAHALASSLATKAGQVVYVPLRGSTIGDNFFSGLLASLFPRSSKVDVIQSLRDGGTVILFDGYDELSMTEEQSRLNRGFVEEVLRETNPANREGHQGLPSVIFLFRSAIRSLGIFDSIEPFSQWLALRFFDETRQRDFLAAYIKHKRPTQHDLRRPCSDFLAALKQRVVMPNPETVEGFFGHAPVLMALGDLILEDASENLMQIAQELLREDFRATQGVTLIDRILTRLLQREVEKFPLNIFHDKGLKAFGAYSLDLQQLLLTRVVSARIDRTPWRGAITEVAQEECGTRLRRDARFGALPGAEQRALEDHYVQEVLQKFQQHPFVDLRQDGSLEFTNPIYAERFLAEHLLAGANNDLTGVFNAYPAPSYYLAQFILESLPHRDLTGRESLLFYVLKSLSSGSQAEFEIEISRPDGRWRITVESGRVLTEPFWYGSEILILTVPDGQILENMNVEGAGDTIVAVEAEPGKDHRRRVTLSNVSIESGDLEITATHLTLNAVRLTGTTIHFGDLVQSIEGAETLSVLGKVDASDFILRKYGSDLRAAAVPDPNADAYLRRKLTQILTWFRKHRAENYGVFGKRFSTVVLAKGRDAGAAKVCEFLRTEGILRDEDQMVVLVQPELARYGVYYVKQNEIRFGGQFTDLVKKWIAFSGKP